MSLSRLSLARSMSIAERAMSGGLSPASRRGRFAVPFANVSSLMSQVTFGYCLVNSSDSFGTSSEMVST